MAQGYSGIPAGPLSAYLGVRQANEQEGLQKFGLLQKMQEAQEARKLREALATQGDVRQRELAAMNDARAREFNASRLEQQQNMLTMQDQWKQIQFGQIKDEGARKLASDAWKKELQTQQLAIQKQLADLKGSPGDAPLKASELLHYIDKEGNHPPVGSTLNDVKQKGYKLASTQEVNMLLAGRGAESTVNQLDKYVEIIWGKEGEDKLEPGIRKRITTGTAFAIDRAKQSNPDLNAYESFAKGTLAPLIRAIGEKGALSDKDIERALNLVPKTGDKLGELPDTSVVARQKMQQLRQWFTNALGKNTGVPKINSDAEYNALPSGTEFIAPDGSRRKKP